MKLCPNIRKLYQMQWNLVSGTNCHWKSSHFYYILLFNLMKIQGLIKPIENDYIKCHKNIYSCDFYQRQDTTIHAIWASNIYVRWYCTIFAKVTHMCDYGYLNSCTMTISCRARVLFWSFCWNRAKFLPKT